MDFTKFAGTKTVSVSEISTSFKETKAIFTW